MNNGILTLIVGIISILLGVAIWQTTGKYPEVYWLFAAAVVILAALYINVWKPRR
jgi:hypothetical protein